MADQKLKWHFYLDAGQLTWDARDIVTGEVLLRAPGHYPSLNDAMASARKVGWHGNAPSDFLKTAPQ